MGMVLSVTRTTSMLIEVLTGVDRGVHYGEYLLREVGFVRLGIPSVWREVPHTSGDDRRGEQENHSQQDSRTHGWHCRIEDLCRHLFPCFFV